MSCCVFYLESNHIARCPETEYSGLSKIYPCCWMGHRSRLFRHTSDGIRSAGSAATTDSDGKAGGISTLPR